MTLSEVGQIGLGMVSFTCTWFSWGFTTNFIVDS